MNTDEEKIPEEISDYNDPQEVPGVPLLVSKVRRFHDCLDEMIMKYRDQKDDELFAVAVLEGLADGCREMGLEQDFGVRMASFHTLFGDKLEMIKSVFQTAYLKEQMKAVPLKFMKKSALLTFKTEAYMKEHYLLRFNEMSGVPEYKHRGLQYSFAPLDSATRNTMSINALKAGLDSWDRDLDRYIDSNLIPRYNPVRDYLLHLPRWDRKDRVTALAQRVKTTNKDWAYYFHVWMLSMVAQWMGRNREHGNAIVPVLIGPQGSGKTSFCQKLLPKSLQTYFSDHLTMRTENDINIAMSSYALINLDEFDTLSRSQQPILKYLLSKHDVKMRPPYGKVVEQRERYASFIATTNNLHPLTDPTGSRRFVCVYADSIDNNRKVNHDQVYAQLMYELRMGERYWFNDKENKRIMQSNGEFQQVKDLPMMVTQTFHSPSDTPADASLMSAREVMGVLAKKYTDVTITDSLILRLGKTLSGMGYEKIRHCTMGYRYRIAEFLKN